MVYIDTLDIYKIIIIRLTTDFHILLSRAVLPTKLTLTRTTLHRKRKRFCHCVKYSVIPTD